MTNDDLKNIQSLNFKDLRLGIPARLFGLCIAMPGIVAFKISGVVGIALLIAMLLPMYLIHKDDPEAFSLYFDEFMAPPRYKIEVVEVLPILIILDNGKIVEYEEFLGSKDEHFAQKIN